MVLPVLFSACWFNANCLDSSSILPFKYVLNCDQQPAELASGHCICTAQLHKGAILLCSERVSVHDVHTCRYIDGRVWPEKDELEVRLMMDLIKHVTGKCQKTCHTTVHCYLYVQQIWQLEIDDAVCWLSRLQTKLGNVFWRLSSLDWGGCRLHFTTKHCCSQITCTFADLFLPLTCRCPRQGMVCASG